MCSIGGWISSKPLDPEDSLRLTQALLWYGAERGRQSAGVWAHGRTVKRALDPARVVNIKAVVQLVHRPTSLVLTHTRQPTCGGTGDGQAQPFTIGDVTTAHNGHISNIKEMKEKFGLTKASGVDSELFASFAGTHGILKMPEFFAEVTGSMAVAAVAGGELYLIRESNPIEYQTIELAGGTKLLVFGSTYHQVRSALMSCWLLPHGTTTTITPGPLFRVSPTGVTQVADRVCKVYVPPKTSRYGVGFQRHGSNHTWRWDKLRLCLVDEDGMSKEDYEEMKRWGVEWGHV